MPSLGRQVVTPFNPQNLILPNRISVWFAPFDAAGRQTTYFELGDLQDIEVNIAETFVEKKSARQGVLSTIKRMISELVGEITMNISEVVGRNLELLFRPMQTILRDGVANAEATIYERTRPRLTGTTAVEIAPNISVERAPGGELFYKGLTILSVTNLNGTVIYTGGGVDYTITAAVAGVQALATLTVASFTAIAGTTITIPETDGGTATVLTVGTDLEDGPTAGSTAAFAQSITDGINAKARTVYAIRVGSTVEVRARLIDGTTPGDITATGATLIADIGATNAYAGAVATAPAKIARVGTGAIPNGAEVVVNFTFTRQAVEYQLQSGQILEGALRIQILSTAGPQGYYEFDRVSCEIGGNITLNPAEFHMAPLKFVILNAGDGRRGRFVQMCNFADFFVDAQSVACSAAA